MAANLAAKEPPALDGILERERGSRLAECVSGLPIHYREVLSLRFEEEMKLEDIAIVLDAPLSTVKTRVARHVHDCTACAAELDNWQLLARGLRRLPTPQPATGVVERARARAELAFGEEAEQRWNRNVLAFLIAFAWTLTVLSWRSSGMRDS